MKLIIPATTRADSRTLQVCKVVEKIYQDLNEEVKILDLKDIPFSGMLDNSYAPDAKLVPYLDEVVKSEALIIVCPEYNGGVPGLLKHFMDHWKHPESFVSKPVAFIGLGVRFGASRPISHLSDTFVYCQSFVFPMVIFIQDVFNVVNDGKINSDKIKTLLKKQAINFSKFSKALNAETFEIVDLK